MQLLCNVVMCGILALAATQGKGIDDETALKMRVQEYARHWIDQRYDRVWKIMSPGLRKGNDNNQSKFASYVRNMRLVVVEVQLQKIKIEGQKATVVTLSKCLSKVDHKILEEMNEEYWVKIKGQWYFDNYRTIK